MIFEPELITKFKKKYLIDDEDNWLWQGPYHDGEGSYGLFQYSYRGKKYRHYAHKYYYIYIVGDIPTEIELHHKCEIPCCVNPDHLTPLTTSEHKACHTDSECCPHGHARTPENTYVMPNGYPSCKPCRIESTREWRRRNR